MKKGPNNLTGKEILLAGIVTGLCDEQGNLKQEYTDNIQQHSVDLNLKEVSRITGPGFIPKSGKTKLAARTPVEPTLMSIEGQDAMVWMLPRGSYDVVFEQGCVVPENIRLNILHRSSTLRNGSLLISGHFDAGFHTENMGAVLTVNEPIWIEVGARVGTATTTNSNRVDNLYSGQYQGDRQRNK